MEDKLKIVKEILKKYNQEHLIQFYAVLTESQKSDLLNQILEIDFDEILYLYEKSKQDVLDSTEEVAPLDYSIKADLTKSQLRSLSSTGLRAIKSGKVGVITLAGGQGSRLGFSGPKGTFKLDTTPKKYLLCILKI